MAWALLRMGGVGLAGLSAGRDLGTAGFLWEAWSPKGMAWGLRPLLFAEACGPEVRWGDQRGVGLEGRGYCLALRQ